MEHTQLIGSKRVQVIKKYVTTVTLIKPNDGLGDNGLHIFNCPDCKNPVLQYRGEIASILPGFTPVELPIIVQCSNRDCRRKYSFNYFAEEDIE